MAWVDSSSEKSAESSVVLQYKEKTYSTAKACCLEDFSGNKVWFPHSQTYTFRHVDKNFIVCPSWLWAKKVKDSTESLNFVLMSKATWEQTYSAVLPLSAKASSSDEPSAPDTSSADTTKAMDIAKAAYSKKLEQEVEESEDWGSW